VEVCAESGLILQHLATRLEEDGGFALFADYGHDGSKTDTFRVSIPFLYTILNSFIIRTFKFNPIIQEDNFFQLNISRLQVLVY
jgi:SAM-dependent MidA family methyltransferase